MKELIMAKYGEIALKGLNKLYNSNIIWRSTGIGLLNLIYKETYQSDLFNNNEKQHDDNLGKALDELEDRFGKNIIRIGV